MPAQHRVQGQTGQDVERCSRLRNILARWEQDKSSVFPIVDGIADDEDARSLIVNGNVARGVTGRRNDREIHDSVSYADRDDRTRGRDVRFQLSAGREFCRWHLDQAMREAASAPRIHDGALSLGQLEWWAREFDSIGAGSTWPAAEFVAWLNEEQAAPREFG
jgi:hypothetical protein